MDPSTEDEWEYIYSLDQTETITLTIDLSATPIGPSTTLPSQEATNQESTQEASERPPDPKSKPGSIQFLDLHSSVPYISYKGQILTGEWGETLGSDLIFASTGDLPSDIEPVMHSSDGTWCLLGVSQSTLVATPVELVKRSQAQANGLLSDVDDFGASLQSTKPFKIMIPADADPKQRKQATFLEQLMAIKLAKGEKDVVYLGRSTTYVDSDGKEGRGPAWSKRDWDLMERDGVEPDARQAKKTRFGNEGEESAPEGSRDDQDEENEVDSNEEDADGDQDVEESRMEDEEVELGSEVNNNLQA